MVHRRQLIVRQRIESGPNGKSGPFFPPNWAVVHAKRGNDLSRISRLTRQSILRSVPAPTAGDVEEQENRQCRPSQSTLAGTRPSGLAHGRTTNVGCSRAVWLVSARSWRAAKWCRTASTADTAQAVAARKARDLWQGTGVPCAMKRGPGRTSHASPAPTGRAPSAFRAPHRR